MTGAAPRPTSPPGASVEELAAEVATAVRGFLAEYHPQGRRGVAKVGEDQNLWREVSSLTLLQLVQFVELKFAIRVRPIDFAPQNFSSIATIARFVGERRRGP